MSGIQNLQNPLPLPENQDVRFMGFNSKANCKTPDTECSSSATFTRTRPANEALNDNDDDNNDNDND